MINRKAKGSKGERELVKFFNENEFSCIRAAGSGSSIYPSPDILAGNAIRRLAIECKVTKDQKKYFQNAEIEQLETFSRSRVRANGGMRTEGRKREPLLYSL